MARVAARREFLAGLLFMAIGAGALLTARGYRLGTATEMGPGFVPTLLAVLLIALGAGAALSGAGRTHAATIEAFPLASTLTVLGGVGLFAVLMPRLGLVPATSALVLVSCLGRMRRAPVEAVALAIILAAVAGVLFIYGLGMPFRLFAWPTFA